LNNQNKRDSAIILVQKGLTFVNDAHQEALMRSFYGHLSATGGFYSIAQAQEFKALEIALTLKDSSLITTIYTDLGAIGDETNLPNKAIDYYQKALAYSPNETRAKNNLARTLTEINPFKAIPIFQEILSIDKDSLAIAIIHNNLGDCFIRIKNYDSAYKHIKATLEISYRTRDSVGIMFDNKLMGTYYFQLNQFNKAKKHFYVSLQLDKKFSNSELTWNSSEFPSLLDQIVRIYTIEKNMDSVIWFKNKVIEFQGRLLAEQKKNTAEFVFSGQEEGLKVFVQKQEQVRKGLTEYYAIALVLMFSIVLYFIISGKDLKRKYAPFISIVILILMFEFILVIFDPLISKITHDEPIYTFGINVLLALMLVPMQSLGEKNIQKFAVDIRLRRIESSEVK